METFEIPKESFTERLKAIKADAINFLKHVYTDPQHEDEYIGKVGERLVKVFFQYGASYANGIIFTCHNTIEVWYSKDGYRYEMDVSRIELGELVKVAEKVRNVQGLEMNTTFGKLK